ncbi:mothers against decapentaplegic homolog 6-like [Tubulanus polymorphus]|uniref:mothers against decapentaplegic homolog 6-like n=1 Tax=Tubulanus polymorphus TaxID=672921 RepID=UPI003DA43B15
MSSDGACECQTQSCCLHVDLHEYQSLSGAFIFTDEKAGNINGERTNKRSALIKRIWKNRAVSSSSLKHETAGSSETPTTELESTLHALLKRLKESQLESLAQCLESRGGEMGVCVPLPDAPVRVGTASRAAATTRPVDLLLCQVFRWPELAAKFERKKLPCCAHNESGFICCNPYHYSILIVPEVPRHEDICDIKKLSSSWKDTPPSDPVSTETGGDPSYLRAGESQSQDGTYRRFWCNVAYWENRQRVGRLYTVTEQSVNIFQQLPRGDGMCLAVLQDSESSGGSCGGGATGRCSVADVGVVNSPATLENIKRTREKIGHGLVLSKETDGVWVYNRSAHAVFVNSPTMEPTAPPSARTFTVHKVAAGHAVKVFDYEMALLLECARDPRSLDGPYDGYAVRVSFAKGWGSTYSRQFIMSCPCWIEILLHVQR